MVKTGNSPTPVGTGVGRRQPSNFPSSPPVGRPASYVPRIKGYRVRPKVVNQGFGAAGGGGAPEFDDQHSNEKPQESERYPDHRQYQSNHSKKRVI